MDSWEFDVLGIYNYHKPGKLDGYFRFIRQNLHLKGDICEAGVFQGKVLLATCLLLKELGSDKTVYGFDTFTGLPKGSPEDMPEVFDALHYEGVISDAHYEDVVKLRKYRKGKPLSLSGLFVQTSTNRIRNAAHLLGLDNFKLIRGEFKQTMKGDYRFMAANLDCDLYKSYKTALPFVWHRMEKGYIHLDEYYSLKFPGPMLACTEFENETPGFTLEHKRTPGDFERWYVRK